MIQDEGNIIIRKCFPGRKKRRIGLGIFQEERRSSRSVSASCRPGTMINRGLYASLSREIPKYAFEEPGRQVSPYTFAVPGL